MGSMLTFILVGSAGVTDSALTNHGMLQVEKLAGYLSQQGVRFTRVFCSPLQRARATADALKSTHGDTMGKPFVVPCLREKDYGSLEGKSWVSPNVNVKEKRDSFTPAETFDELSSRAKEFVKDFLLPLLRDGSDNHTVAVVSHGVILSVIWRTLKQMRVPPCSSSSSHGIPGDPLVMWSNTGYLELDLSMAMATDQNQTALSNLEISVLAINSRQHLTNLKRTRGIGNSKHNPKQQKLGSFFHRRQ